MFGIGQRCWTRASLALAVAVGLAACSDFERPDATEPSLSASRGELVGGSALPRFPEMIEYV